MSGLLLLFALCVGCCLRLHRCKYTEGETVLWLAVFDFVLLFGEKVGGSADSFVGCASGISITVFVCFFFVLSFFVRLNL